MLWVLIVDCEEKNCSAGRESWDIALGFIRIMQSAESHSNLFLAPACGATSVKIIERS